MRTEWESVTWAVQVTMFKDFSPEKQCISCEFLQLRIPIFDTKCLKFICPLKITSSCTISAEKLLSPNVSVLFLKRFSDLFLQFSQTPKEQQSI